MHQQRASITASVRGACSSCRLLPPLPRDGPGLRRCDTSLVHDRQGGGDAVGVAAAGGGDEGKRRGERGWQDGRRGACARPAGLRAAGCWLTRGPRVSSLMRSVACGPHQYFSSPNARAPKPGGRPVCSRVGGRRSAASHGGSPGPPRPGGRVPIIATRRRPGPQVITRRPGSVRCHRAAQAMRVVINAGRPRVARR